MSARVFFVTRDLYLMPETEKELVIVELRCKHKILLFYLLI